ncbi:MAG: transposase [Akkermansia sp.]|nr:transposase [Akkermansia sp.]
MHTLFSLKYFLPIDVYVSDGKVGNTTGAFHVLPGKRSIIVADRGYTDTGLWRVWDSMGTSFVGRLKRTSNIGSLESSISQIMPNNTTL